MAQPSWVSETLHTCLSRLFKTFVPKGTSDLPNRTFFKVVIYPPKNTKVCTFCTTNIPVDIQNCCKWIFVFFFKKQAGCTCFKAVHVWPVSLTRVFDPCLWPVSLTRVFDPCLWPVSLTRVFDPCLWPVSLTFVFTGLFAVTFIVCIVQKHFPPKWSFLNPLQLFFLCILTTRFLHPQHILTGFLFKKCEPFASFEINVNASTLLIKMAANTWQTNPVLHTQILCVFCRQ